jgi:hypothetical protein
MLCLRLGSSFLFVTVNDDVPVPVEDENVETSSGLEVRASHVVSARQLRRAAAVLD